MADSDYTGEIWKTIPFADDYAVSDHGRVKRLTRWWNERSEILNPSPNGDGYPEVAIVPLKGRRGNICVHTLVVWMFLGPPPSPLHQIAHADGVRTNNRVSNLRWATPLENAADTARLASLKGENNPASKLTRDQAFAIRAARIARRPVRALMAEYGISESQVYRIEKGHSWPA